MRKTVSTIIIVSCILSVLFGASSKKDVQIDTFASYLKNEAYIASVGRGETASGAEQNALEGISKYFSMHINVTSEEQTVSDNSGTNSILTDTSFITSETNLFAVHYETPRYDKSQKLYETVAWIDREEAWTIYEPQLTSVTVSFEKLFDSASTENDSLRKAVSYASAQKYAEQNDMERKLTFAAILYPASTGLYSRPTELMSEIPSLIASLLAQISVSIECSSDSDDCIKNAALLSLQKFQLSSTVSKEEDQYVCSIKIEENRQNLTAGTFYVSSYTVSFINKGIAVLSCVGKIKKVGARSPGVAHVRAYKELASAVSNDITNLLNGND